VISAWCWHGNGGEKQPLLGSARRKANDHRVSRNYVSRFVVTMCLTQHHFSTNHGSPPRLTSCRPWWTARGNFRRSWSMEHGGIGIIVEEVDRERFDGGRKKDRDELRGEGEKMIKRRWGVEGRRTNCREGMR